MGLYETITAADIAQAAHSLAERVQSHLEMVPDVSPEASAEARIAYVACWALRLAAMIDSGRVVVATRGHTVEPRGRNHSNKPAFAGLVWVMDPVAKGNSTVRPRTRYQTHPESILNSLISAMRTQEQEKEREREREAAK